VDIRNGKIIMPTIYVPTWTEMYTQAGVGLRGEMEWELFERHNGKEVAVRRGKQRNLIVDTGLDLRCRNLTWGTTILVSHMGVGTNTTDPIVSQNSLIAQLGDRKQYTARNTVRSDSDEIIPWSTYVFEFQESEANGDLAEWGVFYEATGTDMWCRELFRDENGDPVVVTKTDTQVLRFTYKIYTQRVADSSTAIITADGTEYTCTTTINNEQLVYNHITGIGYADSSKIVIVLGASNAASDIVNDKVNTRKGTLIGEYTYSQCPRSLSTYVAGTHTRNMSVAIGGSYGNGDIGEALFTSYKGSPHNTNFCHCRVTYNPVIPKTESKKLYLGVEWSFARI
jgi:hypothetical protein